MVLFDRIHLNALCYLNDSEELIPGVYQYNFRSGDALPVGENTISVTFVPEDRVTYAIGRATRTLTVAKKPPAVDWPVPLPIVYGMPLNSFHFNAVCIEFDGLVDLSGNFSYDDDEGTVLNAGKNILRGTFTPENMRDFAIINIHTEILVLKYSPKLIWDDNSSVYVGETITVSHLRVCCVDEIPGEFKFRPYGPGDKIRCSFTTNICTFVVS
jgi:hypothetical protein